MIEFRFSSTSQSNLKAQFGRSSHSNIAITMGPTLPKPGKQTGCNLALPENSEDVRSTGDMTTTNNDGARANDRPLPPSGPDLNPDTPKAKVQLQSPSPWAYEFSWGDGVILFDGQVMRSTKDQSRRCSEPISSGADGIRTTTSASFHTKVLDHPKSGTKKHREMEPHRGQNNRDKSSSRSK